MTTPLRPTLLTIAGHDPTGGAGIQADIETFIALGCAATSCITCLTVQDSHNVRQLQPLQPGWLAAQLDTLLADIPVAAIKIGLIGDATLVPVIAERLAQLAQIPVVFDPVLAAGGGSELASDRLLTAIREQLLPLTTLLTPNSIEARRLSGEQHLDQAADRLLASGCGAVLITGSHEPTDTVTHRLYRPNQPTQEDHWPRLPHSYHGSGCTLASAISARLALGNALPEAVQQGQAYTWESLQHGYQPGGGQHLPNRLFRCHPGDDQ